MAIRILPLVQSSNVRTPFKFPLFPAQSGGFPPTTNPKTRAVSYHPSLKQQFWPLQFTIPEPETSSADPRNLRNWNLNPTMEPCGWTCGRCTYLNQCGKLNFCELCDCPRIRSSESAAAAAEWACGRCTFRNGPANSVCEMCGAVPPDSLSSEVFNDAIDDDDEAAAAAAAAVVGSVFRPLYNKKRASASESSSSSAETGSSAAAAAGKRPAIAVAPDQGWVSMKKCATPTSSSSSASAAAANVKIEEKSSSLTESEFLKDNTFIYMTYNVWFDSTKMYDRMKALGDLIELHQPHVICLQEVTPDIYDIFQRSSWWGKYTCSVTPELSKMRPYFCIQLSRLPVNKFSRKAFRNSIMGRELCIAEVDIGNGKQLAVATTHLESPCPAPPTWNQYFSKERVAQANESMTNLSSIPNAVFGGDMNWDEGKDGPFPVPDGWFDAWLKLRPTEDGWTYDTKSNQMLAGNRTLRKRLDRILCHLRDFELETIDMIGADPIPGILHRKEKKIKGQIQCLNVPVLPSDHFGLLMKLKLVKK